jgi:hypothetical protein
MSGIPFTAIYPNGPGSAAAGGAAVDAGNPAYPGMPAGSSPIHKDATYLAPSTYTLWQPSSGNRFVLAHAMVSTDAAMRIALVDGADIPGSRPVDGSFSVNGGAIENGVPVPYPSKTVGNPLLVVVGGAPGAIGVKISVDGWEVPG